jgi:X-X-X-Leu-X-X-Gly heptad repeat protein
MAKPNPTYFRMLILPALASKVALVPQFAIASSGEVQWKCPPSLWGISSGGVTDPSVTCYAGSGPAEARVCYFTDAENTIITLPYKPECPQPGSTPPDPPQDPAPPPNTNPNTSTSTSSNGAGKLGPPTTATEVKTSSSNVYNEPAAAVKTVFETVESTSQTNEVSPTSKTAATAPSVSVLANELDQKGTDQFNGGVTKLAQGITQLAQATQEEAPDAAGVHDALATLAAGRNDVNLGRDTVLQANISRVRNAAVGNIGSGASQPSTHQLAFDPAKASPEARAALKEMEEQAGVPVEKLIQAVNGGKIDEILGLAAGATQGSYSEAELAAAMPNFGVSEAPAMGQPTGPVYVGVQGHSQSEQGSAKRAAPDPKTAARHQASANLIEGHEGQDFDGLTPADGALAGFGSSPEADPDANLFTRVTAQYSKRRAELAPAKAKSAR